MFYIQLLKNLTQLFADGYAGHKELFKIWTQRKGEHSNIHGEYFQNSVTGMYRYFCF